MTARIIDGKALAAGLMAKATEVAALPERWVTVHSGDMGYTIGPFAGAQDALEGV